MDFSGCLLILDVLMYAFDKQDVQTDMSIKMAHFDMAAGNDALSWGLSGLWKSRLARPRPCGRHRSFLLYGLHTHLPCVSVERCWKRCLPKNCFQGSRGVLIIVYYGFLFTHKCQDWMVVSRIFMIFLCLFPSLSHQTPFTTRFSSSMWVTRWKWRRVLRSGGILALEKLDVYPKFLHISNMSTKLYMLYDTHLPYLST